MDVFSIFNDPLKLIKFILGAKKWSGKHNGVALASVDKIDGGLNGLKQRLWFSANCHEGTAAHKLIGSTRLTQPGTQGGDDTLTLDQKDVAKDDIVIGANWWPFPPVLVLTFKYDDDAGLHHRWEFKTPLL